MPRTAAAGLRFGRFELQPGERRLLVDGAPVAVGPRAFDLLVVLVQRGGHLVTKDELMDRVWSNVIVEDNTLQVHISALRRILGPEAIATVSGRGYRFDLPLEQGRDDASSPKATPKHNLPHQLTTFVGRERELGHLQALLGASRLLTLTGSGGCGKTRIALQAAADALEQFPDGIWLVELAALVDSQLVPQTVAVAVGVKEQASGDLAQSVVEHLVDKRALIILDNAEHLLAACAQFSNAVLRQCAHVAILTTSRELLGIEGERTYRVPSLSLPDSSQPPSSKEVLACDSARLFVERVQLFRPAFRVTEENAATLAAVCRRLDGIPLAIELAAPRLRSMTLQEMHRRLDGLFSLLTGGSRTALPRQRTLRSLIDWSYDLLTASEQALLCRLSVFSGGWSLEGATSVCAGGGIGADSMLDLLTSLADKSLIVVEEQEGATRYQMLEMVRDYAMEQLRLRTSEAPWPDRHLSYFLEFAQMCEKEIEGPQQQSWLDRVEAELDNLRAALAQSCTSEANVTRGLALVPALFRFWLVRGYVAEGRDWAARVREAATPGVESFHYARTTNTAGILATEQGDYAAGRAAYEEALAIWRKLGDRRRIAGTLNNLSAVLRGLGELAAARAMQEECLAVFRELGNPLDASSALGTLGRIVRDQGDYQSALGIFKETLAMKRAIGDLHGVAQSLRNIGTIACQLGQADSARAPLEEGLALFQRLGDISGLARTLEGLALLACVSHDPRWAAGIWGAAEKLRLDVGAPLSPDARSHYDEQVALARVALGDDQEFDAAWKQGGALTPDEAVRYASAAARP